MTAARHVILALSAWVSTGCSGSVTSTAVPSTVSAPPSAAEDPNPAPQREPAKTVDETIELDPGPLEFGHEPGGSGPDHAGWTPDSTRFVLCHTADYTMFEAPEALVCGVWDTNAEVVDDMEALDDEEVEALEARIEGFDLTRSSDEWPLGAVRTLRWELEDLPATDVDPGGIRVLSIHVVDRASGKHAPVFTEAYPAGRGYDGDFHFDEVFPQAVFVSPDGRHVVVVVYWHGEDEQYPDFSVDMRPIEDYAKKIP